MNNFETHRNGHVWGANIVFFCFLATVVLCRDTFFVACFFFFGSSPSWELTYPIQRHFWRFFSFSSGGDMSVSWRVEKNLKSVFFYFPSISTISNPRIATSFMLESTIPASPSWEVFPWCVLTNLRIGWGLIASNKLGFWTPRKFNSSPL